jgi:uncharacterized protein (DUF488 family)
MALLNAHDIRQLIDVRTIPRSRHNPQFNSETLARTLVASQLSYRHAPALGGLRRARKDSNNTGWRNASFRGYADYMETDESERALEELILSGAETNTAIMCAEAVPWRCHRSLIADALVCRGWVVHHIMTETKADTHHLTSFAIIEGNKPTYPAPRHANEAPRLF